MRRRLGLALALALWTAGALAATEPPRVRVVVFWEEGFPTVDAPAPARRILEEALAGHAVLFRPASAFAKALDDEAPQLVVLPYGSAFPEEVWGAFERFLARGGSWLQLGGVPLSVPVGLEGGRRVRRARTTALHRALGLVRAEPVDASEVAAWREVAPWLGGTLARLAPSRLFAFDVRFATAKERPDEDGSDGIREARLVPLVHGLSQGGTPVAAPAVSVDRLRGAYAGGRWVFSASDATLASPAIRALATHALEGAAELTVAPATAVTRPGETPSVTVTLLRPGRPLPPRPVALVALSLPGGGAGPSLLVPLGPDGTGRAALPVPPGPLASGLHVLRATVELAGDGAPVVLQGGNGFLVAGEDALAGGPALTAGRDLLRKDGAPFAVAGMTAMASDVHRRFLLEPDPAVLERDFAAMEAAGVNLVRTGIWTGWSAHAPGGVPSEEVLRALEAYVLTARRHGMPVVFTLFAFLPETWGGGNAYLDPRALAAQETFVRTLARRLAPARDVAWDLVNEPSFASPRHLWQTRPNGDGVEAAAFRAWLLARERTGTQAERAARVAARWRALPDEPLGVPSEGDFADRFVSGPLRHYRALDFRLFAQDAFAGWARRMSAAIRAGGSTGFVTVGTDEGGAGEMPNPLFFGDAVDVTGTHTWWNGGDLLWDVLASKLPDRPSLVGETGLMSYERLDGTPLRSAHERRVLFARKLALALGGGGAGFVPWIWATNPYMPSDNESGIGLYRVDGTARPELADFTAFARFVREAAPLLGDHEPAEAAVLVPHARMLSVRDQATEATRRAVRLLELDLGTRVRLVAEHRAARDLPGARLVVVPSPSVLADDAWEALLSAAREGATVAVSGTIDEDPWGIPRPRLASLAIAAERRPVATEDTLAIGDTVHRVRFRGSLLERLERAVLAGDARPRVHEVTVGAGVLLFCPLPVELADDEGVARALYAVALERARLGPPVEVTPRVPGVLVRVLSMPRALLLAVVSERDEPLRLRLRPLATKPPVDLDVPRQGSVLLLLDRATGTVRARSDAAIP